MPPGPVSKETAKPKLPKPLKAAIEAGASVYWSDSKLIIDFKSIKASDPGYLSQDEFSIKRSKEDAAARAAEKQQRYYDRVLTAVKKECSLGPRSANKEDLTIGLSYETRKALPEGWLKSLTSAISSKPESSISGTVQYKGKSAAQKKTEHKRINAPSDDSAFHGF